MPYASSGGVRLYYEEAGKGMPILFVHEFSGDFRSWEAQMRHFSRRYRCVAFNARGYPPSDVPRAASKYSHTLATDDISSLMRRLGIGRAHVVGCSMGAYSTLLFGLRYPRRALSLTVVGAGAGADPARRAEFLKSSAASARRFEEGGLTAAMKPYRNAANRVQLERKDPRAWREFFKRFSERSAIGHANTIRGVQMRRPPLQGMGSRLARLVTPLLVVVGDEDESSLDTGLFLKRVCPAARLAIVPSTGHVVNVEEPDTFNRITGDFLSLVDSGRWRPRDPRSYNPSTMARR
ncbi:MAG: alpha/beta fold hydrolase [Burkholderiales bacterium]